MTTNNHLNNFIELDSKSREELLKTADELVKVKHLDLDNTKYLAKILFYLQKYDESIEQYKRALTLNSEDEHAIVFIGINYFKKGDYETAIKYFNQGFEKDSENECLLSYKMLSHEFINDYDNAIKCGEQILKNNPKNISVINRLIDYHFELKNYDDCLDYINQIEYKDNYKKALILYESKQYEECIETASKIKTAQSYHLAGKAYYKLDNTVKAVKYLFKSYETDFNIEVLLEISDIYFEAKDYKKAIYFLKKILIHDDLNVEAYSKIAFAYLESLDWLDAIEYAEKALEISKKVPQAYITLAEAYVQLETREKALNIIEEGLCENPKSVELWVEKGGLNFPYDMITFRESYKKAISLNPMDYTIYLKYIDLLLIEDEFDEVKKYYNKLLLVNPLFEKSFQELRDRWNLY